jgi:protein gp37
MGMPKYRGLTRKSGRRAVWTGKVTIDRSALEIPLRWKKPRFIFVNSMSDLFHEDVPADFITDVWGIMRRVPQHTFQILTKRPERMADISQRLPLLRNVWLGASVENAEYLSRLDALRHTNAAVRFVSFEPLLGSVRMGNLIGIQWAIVGGESGPRAREMKADWVEEIRDLCRRYGTAFFFKQWGGQNKKRTGRRLDGRTWDEYPVTTAEEYAMQPAAQA